jgi:hypothetical protein
MKQLMKRFEKRFKGSLARRTPVVISGRLGDDAKQYQIRAVRKALAEAKQ